MTGVDRAAAWSAVPGPDAAGWTHWPAPAKLNLFLRITGRRADGYHRLQSMFRILHWGDSIALRPRADGRIGRIGGSAMGVAEADDLAVRAARLLQTATGCTRGADIIVHKEIPAGAGFGGGSSDAATVLRALDRLWGLNLPLGRLAALGLQLGADVPVFIEGRNAWAEGVGERLTPLEVPTAWYLLIEPGIHVATADLFQAADLTRDCAPATMEHFVADAFAQGIALGNVFEPVLRRRMPAVEAVFAGLACVGRLRLTGTGSGCFIEFAMREQAEAALEQVRAQASPGVARVVAGAIRSPLLDALGALQPRKQQGRRQEA